MIFSMTAFARRERATPWGSLAWELRSVNHRYLEVALRLPEELRGLEPKVREGVAERITRGRVDASLYWKPDQSGAQAIELDTVQLARVTDAIKALGQTGAAIAPAAALDLLRWPGVIRTQTLDIDGLNREALTLLTQTLDELRETRAREGARLKQFMLERLAAVEEHVKAVQIVLPDALKAFRERLDARLAEVSASLDRSRLEQEIVLFANRMDVAEELERLAAHVQEARRALDGGGQIGRRLDFLMQEFNREANTLGSKSADLRVTNAAVELKVLVEQMREQVQNVE